MPKMKKSDRPTVSWEADLAREIDQHEQRQGACLAILMSMAKGEEVSPDEQSYLTYAGYSDPDIRRELGRMVRAIKQYEIAGSKEDRELAKKRLEALEAELGDPLARLEEEIKRLEAEAKKAKERLDEARNDVERRRLAIEQLTSDQLLPVHVVRQLGAVRKRKAESEPARIVRECEERIRMIESVLALSGADQIFLHADGLKISTGRNLFTMNNDGAKIYNRQVDPTLWSQYLAELREELPKVKAEMAKAEQEFVYFENEAQAIREFYLTEFEEQQGG